MQLELRQSRIHRASECPCECREELFFPNPAIVSLVLSPETYLAVKAKRRIGCSGVFPKETLARNTSENLGVKEELGSQEASSSFLAPRDCDAVSYLFV